MTKKKANGDVVKPDTYLAHDPIKPIFDHTITITVRYPIDDER